MNVVWEDNVPALINFLDCKVLQTMEVPVLDTSCAFTFTAAQSESDGGLHASLTLKSRDREGYTHFLNHKCATWTPRVNYFS